MSLDASILKSIGALLPLDCGHNGIWPPEAMLVVRDVLTAAGMVSVNLNSTNDSVDVSHSDDGVEERKE